MLTVNRRFKLYFFLTVMANGAFIPFMALFFTFKGMSGGELALLLGMMPLVRMAAQPFWSYLSDVLRARRNLLAVTLLLAGLGVAAYHFAAGLAGLAAVTLVFSIMDAPTIPVGTALALDYLEKEGRIGDYGTLRLWGSVGFILSAFLAGRLLNDALLPYIPFGYSLCVLLAGLLTWSLPEAPPLRAPNWLEGLRLLPANPLLARFLLGMLFIGATIGISSQYLAVNMRGLGASGWVIGAAVSFQAISEVPLMALTPRLVNRYGLPAVLLAGMAVLPLRWLLYLTIRQPLLILPVQFFHGMTIVSALVVGVMHVDRQLPGRWRATGQGLYSAAFMGLGNSAGLFLAGLIYGRMGIGAVWAASIFLSLAGIAVIASALRRKPLLALE